MGVWAGRKGRRWQAVRAEVLATSTVCHLCGHAGSGDVDHTPSRRDLLALGLDPEDPIYLRPAHGSLSRCRVCGLCCNQVKGSGRELPTIHRSEDW